jgi:hypothetical protein
MPVTHYSYEGRVYSVDPPPKISTSWCPICQMYETNDFELGLSISTPGLTFHDETVAKAVARLVDYYVYGRPASAMSTLELQTRYQIMRRVKVSAAD